MHRYQEAIEKLLKNNRNSAKHQILVTFQAYIEGDEKLLQPLMKSGSYEFDMIGDLLRSMPGPSEMDDTERRVLRLLIRRSSYLMNGPNSYKRTLDQYLSEWIREEKPGEDRWKTATAEAMACGVPMDRWQIYAMKELPMSIGDKLTSVARSLESLPPDTLLDLTIQQIKQQSYTYHFLLALAVSNPQLVLKLAQMIVAGNRAMYWGIGVWGDLLRIAPALMEKTYVAAFRQIKKLEIQCQMGLKLDEQIPGKYEEEVYRLIKKHLQEEPHRLSNYNGWLLKKRGVAEIPLIISYVESAINPRTDYRYCSEDMVIGQAVYILKRDAMPILLAVIRRNNLIETIRALREIIGFKNPTDTELLEMEIAKNLESEDGSVVVAYLALAETWDMNRMAPRVWLLLEHASKPARDAAANALGSLGAKAVAPAVEYLKKKKSDTRIAAARLLGATQCRAEAGAALKEQMKVEKSAAVIDAIRAALKALGDEETLAAEKAEASAQAAPAAITRAELDAQIASALKKLKNPAAWLDLSALPAIKWSDGTRVGEDAMRYLLYFQSREKEIAPAPEAKAMVPLLDRATCDEFARTVWGGFLGAGADAKDRWALAIVGMMGPDGLIPEMRRQIEDWALSMRGKLAEYGVQALALMGSDLALMAVDALALKFRVKIKNVGKAATEAFAKAAAARGLSPADLGDRIVPWLGFENAHPRALEFGQSRIEASIGMDFKLRYRDAVKSKPVAALPSGAPDAIKKEMKELGAALKEASKAQLLRMENLLTQQHRWDATRWTDLFLKHPLLAPFAVRLVWGHYDQDGKITGTFRALEDRTLTDARDASVPRSESGRIGIVHPLELDEAARQAWSAHHSDYKIIPPFPQLARPVYRLESKRTQDIQLDDFAGTSLLGITFKGRAERRGWARGSVADAGMIAFYYKPFAAADVDVFIQLDDFYVGIDMDSEIKLQEAVFARHGTVKMGSYEYDSPDKGDARRIKLGDVPPIVFSEAMGDLRAIAGVVEAVAGEETE